jgi:hypothetical protein
VKSEAGVTDAQLRDLLVANGISSAAAASAVEQQGKGLSAAGGEEKPVGAALAIGQPAELVEDGVVEAGRPHQEEAGANATNGPPAQQQKDRGSVTEAQKAPDEAAGAAVANGAPGEAVQGQQEPEQAAGAAVADAQPAEPAAQAPKGQNEWLALAQLILTVTDPAKQAAVASQQLGERPSQLRLTLHAKRLAHWIGHNVTCICPYTNSKH